VDRWKRVRLPATSVRGFSHGYRKDACRKVLLTFGVPAETLIMDELRTNGRAGHSTMWKNRTLMAVITTARDTTERVQQHVRVGTITTASATATARR
jgi:hypothetical protein